MFFFNNKKYSQVFAFWILIGSSLLMRAMEKGNSGEGKQEQKVIKGLDQLPALVSWNTDEELGECKEAEVFQSDGAMGIILAKYLCEQSESIFAKEPKSIQEAVNKLTSFWNLPFTYNEQIRDNDEEEKESADYQSTLFLNRNELRIGTNNFSRSIAYECPDFKQWALQAHEKVLRSNPSFYNYLEKTADLLDEVGRNQIDAIKLINQLPEQIRTQLRNSFWYKYASKFSYLPLIIKTLHGHTASVKGISVLNDNIIASYSGESIKLWSIKTGKCIHKLRGSHANEINCIAFLGDDILASASNDRTVKIWDTITGKCIHTLSGHTGSIYRINALDDGIIASSSMNEIKIWNTKTAICLHTLVENNDYNSILLFTDDAIVAALNDHTMKIWDTKTGVCLHTLKGHTGSILNIIVLDDGTIASDSNDHTIKIWDPKTGVCLYTLQDHETSSLGGYITAFGHHAIISMHVFTHDIEIWTIKTGECQRIKGTYGDSIKVFADGTIALFYKNSGLPIEIWDTKTGIRLYTLSGHNSRIINIIALDDETLVSCCVRGTVKIWNKRTGVLIDTLQDDHWPVSCFRLFGYCTMIKASKVIQKWRIPTLEKLLKYKYGS